MKKPSIDTLYTINLRPDKLRVKLHWYYGYNGTATGAAPVFWQFSGNSPWDPDYAAAGASANMWSTLSTMYNKYMCTYSKIRFEFQMATAGTFTQQFWGLMRTLNQAQPASVVALMAQPYRKYKQIQSLTGQTSKTSVVWHMKSSTPRMLGRKMDPSEDRVSVSADPNEEWIYEFASVSSAVAQVNIVARMTYWVEFSDRAAVVTA